MKERRSKAMGDRGRVRGWLSIALLVNESGAVNALVCLAESDSKIEKTHTRRTGGSSGEKRPFCDILSQLKPTLMHSSALEPPCDARSDELDQKIPAVRRPSKKPLE